MTWQAEAKKMAAEARGAGEALACDWLREQGFEILAQRQNRAARWTLRRGSRGWWFCGSEMARARPILISP
jgi:hypothetical protein